MAKLTITSGPDKGREFPLGDSQVLGRLGRCTIPLKDTRASREHARIYRAPDGFHVIDLNSKNGILVNGQKVEKAKLAGGDEIQVGDTWCRIELDAADAAAFEAASEVRPESARSAATPAPARTPGSAEVLLRAKDGTGRVSDEPLRTGAQRQQRTGMAAASPTRTSLAWLRTDLAQVSSLYRVLLGAGLVLLAGGLGWLAWWLTN